jgi:hypothetical protein
LRPGTGLATLPTLNAAFAARRIAPAFGQKSSSKQFVA